MKPLHRLLHSSKAWVMLTASAAVIFVVYKGKMTWSEAFHFLTVVVPAWMLAVGIEDAAKHTANGKVEAIRLSMRPAALPEMQDVAVPKPPPLPDTLPGSGTETKG